MTGPRMAAVSKPKQSIKTFSPMSFTLSGRLIEVRLLQLAKAPSPMLSTVSGMLIEDILPQPENAPSLMDVIPLLIVTAAPSFPTINIPYHGLFVELYPGISPSPTIVILLIAVHFSNASTA